MTDREQMLQRLEQSAGAGRSIFPNFDVDVPMPASTAAPPASNPDAMVDRKLSDD